MNQASDVTNPKDWTAFGFFIIGSEILTRALTCYDTPSFYLEFLQVGLEADQPMLDGYTALAYIAAVTERARIGTMVTGVIYRQPGHLIKTVTNLDVLSGGRAYLGTAAAWYERETRGSGFSMPNVHDITPLETIGREVIPVVAEF